jgi:hypothetical protein
MLNILDELLAHPCGRCQIIDPHTAGAAHRSDQKTKFSWRGNRHFHNRIPMSVGIYLEPSIITDEIPTSVGFQMTPASGLGSQMQGMSGVAVAERADNTARWRGRAGR